MTSDTDTVNGSAVLGSLDPACHTAEPPRTEDITEASREETEEEKLERKRAKRREYERRWKERHSEVLAAKKRRYAQRNAEKIAEYQRQYRKRHAERLRAQREEYYQQNKSDLYASQRKWTEANKEKVAEYMRQWRAENKDACREWSRQWFSDNPEKHRLYQRRSYRKHREARIRNSVKRAAERRRNNPHLRLRAALSSRLSKALGATGIKKSVKTMELVGCSIEFLRAHIASQFSVGMSWENYGKWHCDHIRPCSSYNLMDEAQQRECFHYSNLRPLWAEENLRKKDKIVDVKMRQASLFVDGET